jgi:hypothetical protein
MAKDIMLNMLSNEACVISFFFGKLIIREEKQAGRHM